MALILSREDDFASRIAAAEHIALEGSRLAGVAAAHRFPLLAYLIDMVVLEAWREVSEPGQEAGSDS